jgi:lipopolysaccharide transport system permease protein
MTTYLNRLFSMRELQRYRELIWVLAARNIKVRYRGSLLGVYWSLLNPLLMTGLYTTIFGTVFAPYYGNSLWNYALSAFTGLVVINFFSTSTTQSLYSIVDNGPLLNKVRLPVSIFPLAAIAANIFQLTVSVLPLLIIVTLLKTGNIAHIPLLILPFSALLIFCVGVGLLTSALYIFFRDLPYFYELVVYILWMSAPVLYPTAIVARRVQPLLSLNPLTPIINSLRQVVFENGLPAWHLLGEAWLGASIILLLGWVCFNYSRPQFIDLL